MNKAQKVAHRRIKEACAEAKTGSVNHTNTLLTNIELMLINPLQQRIEALYQDLAAPTEVLSRQIAAMRHLEEKLEHMEHGIIQAV